MYKFSNFVIVLAFIFVVIFPATALCSTVVRMQTNLGVIDVDLFDEGAPLTVSNFLNYVNRGAYDSSFIHRSVPGFVIQGGGYRLNDSGDPVAIQKDDPVLNEFSEERSNLRGTIAMAKVSGDENSATNQWFFNLNDNSSNLDNQNGGFTVFGRVKENTLGRIDAIAALSIVNDGVFSAMPLVSLPFLRYQAVLVDSVTILPTVAASEAERVFNYFEGASPNLVSPATQNSITDFGYFFRYYSQTNSYLGAANGNIYYLGLLSGEGIVELGPLSGWLETATAAGY